MIHRSLVVLAAGSVLLAACAGQPPVRSVTATPTAPVSSEPVPQEEPVTVSPVIIPAYPSGNPIEPPPPPAVVPPPQVVPPPSSQVYPGEREGRAMVERLIPAGVRDRQGWAADIFDAFAALRLPPSRENLCAAMAVIEQESSWQGDPTVPGLPRIVWKEIDKRRASYGIPDLVVQAALLKPSPDGRSYKKRIDTLRTEKEVSRLFEDMISEVPRGRELLGEKNPVHTGGPMQVSVDFATEQVREKRYPYPRKASLRDEVFSRRGGVYFGVAILLDYPAPYSSNVYRFADFNAGRYASRNAAFQHAVAWLAGRGLDMDGDLLRYKDGQPSNETSATQKVLAELSGRLGMGNDEIQRDLRLEKTASFSQTRLWQRVFALAERTAGRPVTHEHIPEIALKSPKIHRNLTTAWFAQRVDGRYKTCLQRGATVGV
ncbi:MAG: DUF1615 domain-containing protein [Zoogloea sp.]|nr:DUF1615 domain-containing protein [Zoogloea sp.]